MSNPNIFEFEYCGARITLPPNVIVDNFLQSLHPPVEPMAISTYSSTPPAIGAYWQSQGGIYAGIMRGQKGAPDYHLVVAAGDAGFIRKIQWGSQGKDEPRAQCDFDGAANTSALIESDSSHPAAVWADELSIDGCKDWYLPARRELRLCWVNVPELFEDGWYWSSTQVSAYGAWCQDFGDGYQGSDDKANKLRARAVRRLSVIQ